MESGHPTAHGGCLACSRSTYLSNQAFNSGPVQAVMTSTTSLEYMPAPLARLARWVFLGPEARRPGSGLCANAGMLGMQTCRGCWRNVGKLAGGADCCRAILTDVAVGLVARQGMLRNDVSSRDDAGNAEDAVEGRRRPGAGPAPTRRVIFP